jgi:hypothetical protein
MRVPNYMAWTTARAFFTGTLYGGMALLYFYLRYRHARHF